MPSSSKKQQRLMGMAYAYKKDKLDISKMPEDLIAKIKKLADSMSLKDLKDFAETKHDDLPEVKPKADETNENKYIFNFEHFIKENIKK
jgi:CO dehydrogenase/acetyl-CoA synthase beta subunit